ncbi:hypothetical protein GCM10010320_22020 [Streptomyces caelestis]|nr:hypothetical protein GCM10010320_22020 [Streptomyces caelestis]
MPYLQTTTTLAAGDQVTDGGAEDIMGRAGLMCRGLAAPLSQARPLKPQHGA